MNGFLRTSLKFNAVSLSLLWLSSVLLRSGGRPGATGTMDILPPAALFQSLIGDPREPYTGITAYGNQSRFEGAVGETFDFLRYLPPDKTQWGWGVFGQGYILLDENGATFPMRAGDWYAGMYVSETSGDFSHRLEFEHQSAHLGDSLEGLQRPIFFSRENFNYTFAFRRREAYGLYAGLGAWENMFPRGAALFASLGIEIYSPAADVGGRFCAAMPRAT